MPKVCPERFGVRRPTVLSHLQNLSRGPMLDASSLSPQCEMLQDQFLQAIVEARIPVTVYLVNGIRLQAQLESFDQYGLILSGTSQQFVFKHAISTVVPMRDISSNRDVQAEMPAGETEALPQKATTLLRPRIKRAPTK